MFTNYIGERVVVHGLDGNMYSGKLREVDVEHDFAVIEKAWQIRLMPQPKGVALMPTPVGISGGLMEIFTVKFAAMYGDNDMTPEGRKTLEELEQVVRATSAGLTPLTSRGGSGIIQ